MNDTTLEDGFKDIYRKWEDWARSGDPAATRQELINGLVTVAKSVIAQDRQAVFDRFKTEMKKTSKYYMAGMADQKVRDALKAAKRASGLEPEGKDTDRE